jgi:hypothetical protein
MTDLDVDRFDVRDQTALELLRNRQYATHMVLASAAATQAILGAALYFLSLLF